MLGKIGSLRNTIADPGYYNIINTSKKYPIQYNKKDFQKTSSSKEDINQICSRNVESIFTKVKNRNKHKDYSFNSYQFMKEKALKYVNNNKNNNTHKAKKMSEFNHSISPVKKTDKKFIFNSSLCSNNNNPINNNSHKGDFRNLSVCENKNKNNYENNNNKTIREIRIKSKKKLSQILSYKNKNNSTEEKNMTFSNLSRIEKINNNNGNDFNNNTIKKYKKLDTPRIGVYSRKKVNIFKSLSMEKRVMNTIKSIEIDFRPKIYGNSYIDEKYLNSFEIAKVIMIQRFFRRYLEIRNKKINKNKIIIGIQLFKRYVIKNLSCSIKMFFLLYNYKLTKKKKIKHFVNKEQYELLKILKEKNIIGMINFKKYIINLLNNNTLEMF